MNTIHLHGAMRRRFGGPFTLAVATAPEAIHALSRMVPGFERAVREGAWRVIRGPMKGGRALGERELGVNLPGEMHLVAAPRGRKNGQGVGKIILGVVLVAFAVALAFTGAGAALGGAVAGEALAAGATGGFATTFTLSTTLGISVSAGQIAMFGAAMILGGISSVLAGSPGANQQQGQETKPSYLFSGALNSADQGVPVPLALGEGMVGGIVISLGVETKDV